jgi:hypothetical protein
MRKDTLKGTTDLGEDLKEDLQVNEEDQEELSQGVVLRARQDQIKKKDEEQKQLTVHLWWTQWTRRTSYRSLCWWPRGRYRWGRRRT